MDCTGSVLGMTLAVSSPVQHSPLGPQEHQQSWILVSWFINSLRYGEPHPGSMQENQANDKVRDMHSGGIQEGASNTQLKTETPNKPIQT